MTGDQHAMSDCGHYYTAASCPTCGEEDALEEGRFRECERIIAWLRDPGAMSAFDGLSECQYTTAVLPEDLANALEKALRT